MEIEDTFEEWEGSDIEEIEGLKGELGNEEQRGESEEESSDDEEVDEVTTVLRCKKCRKVYRKKSWFEKHQSTCEGASKRQQYSSHQKTNKMSQRQIRTREILANLEVNEYFSTNGLRVVLNLLEEICKTPDETSSVRGARYTDMKLQANGIHFQIKNSQNTCTSAESFLRNVTDELWKITFARDSLTSSSTRQRYVAQHLTDFRSSRVLFDSWAALMKTCGVHSNGKLLLQTIVTKLYENIAAFRAQSVDNALDIADNYQEEKACPTNLTPIEKSIVAYTAGYVCRKTRDNLQRYSNVNNKSLTHAVVLNCERLANIALAITDSLHTGVEKQAPSLSYPNLMSLSLDRGGLSVVNSITFDFFCYLEISIRPFLNLADFRSSTRKSDRELIEQLVDNTPKLVEIFPFSQRLPCYEDRMLLIKLLGKLFYRARKWAYLKVYKEQAKISQRMHENSSKSGSADLHGKDSIRKALMCISTNTSC